MLKAFTGALPTNRLLIKLDVSTVKAMLKQQATLFETPPIGFGVCIRSG